MVNRSALPVALLVGAGVLAGCTGGGRSPEPAGPPSTPEETGPVPPSLAREVPREERVRLGSLSSERMCALVTPEVLGELAFPVQAGRPREVSFDPPVRGCRFEAADGTRSVLVSAQPEGLGTVGSQEVDLGEVRGSRTLHVNDCTVLAGVSRATLQVSVAGADVDTEQCDTATAVAGYVVEALAR